MRSAPAHWRRLDKTADRHANTEYGKRRQHQDAIVLGADLNVTQLPIQKFLVVSIHSRFSWAALESSV
jgi:hypothetical protein